MDPLNMDEHEAWRRDFARLLQEQPESSVPQGVAGARLCVFSCSIALICFYGVQYRAGRCNLHPLYVQFVTFCVYSLSCFGTTDFLYIPIQNHAGETFDLAVGRYLFWMMTCPVIISNVNILLNLMTPDDLELPRVTFMMVKDIVMIAFGVLAAMQKNVTLKWIFNLASYLVCFWLVVDLIQLMNQKKKYFQVHERCWEWILATMIYFFFAQSLFIFLYAVGPPCFNIMGRDGDRIGHSVGDLFAKNLFGFFAWYVRFVVLDPYAKRIRGARAVSPYASPLAAEQKNARNVSFLTRKTQGRKNSGAPRALRVLIVEPKIELQRLFMFILRDAGLEGEIAFDLESATKIIRRDSLRHYDAIILNLAIAFENRIDTQKFRMQFRRKPYYLPLLGYCFDEASYGPLAEREEIERNLSDGFIRHILDEMHLFDVISHWREASSHWREIDQSADMERRLHQHVQGIHMAPIDDEVVKSVSDMEVPQKNSTESRPAAVESPVSPSTPAEPKSAASQYQQPSSGGRIALRRKSSFEAMNDNLRRQLKAEEEQVARLKQEQLQQQQQNRQQQQQNRQQYQDAEDLTPRSPMDAADEAQSPSYSGDHDANYRSTPQPYAPPSSIDSQSRAQGSSKGDDLADEELGPKRRTSLIVKGSMM